MAEQSQRYLYGDRQLWLQVGELLEARSDVIVLPADGGLSQDGVFAGAVIRAAGETVSQQMQQLRVEYGQIDSGMALFTAAGDLPFQAIIHAVVPERDEGDAQRLVEQATSRTLQLCDMNEWQSVALPALGSGEEGIDETVVAKAIYRAITRFWDARQEGLPNVVVLCLSREQYPAFVEVFEQRGMDVEPEVQPQTPSTAAEPVAGHVELSDEEIEQLKDVDIDEWFK